MLDLVAQPIHLTLISLFHLQACMIGTLGTCIDTLVKDVVTIIAVINRRVTS